MGGRADGGVVDRGFEIEEMLFSDIPGAVSEGRAEAGLLIHEAQLTFAGSGLRLLADLGQWWGEVVGGPLPLGLNVVRRDLDKRHGPGAVDRLARVLSRSVHHAVEHKAESRRYLKLNRGDRSEWDDDALLDRYLDMYVSGLTLDMGEPGVAALGNLLGRAHDAGLCASPGDIDVV
jgi:1,4-dihydroxy-6-naphthoate synthase